MIIYIFSAQYLHDTKTFHMGGSQSVARTKAQSEAIAEIIGYAIDYAIGGDYWIARPYELKRI